MKKESLQHTKLTEKRNKTYTYRETLWF